MSDDYRTESRKRWSPQVGYGMTDDQVLIGCLQRIADSLEQMAKPYVAALEAAQFERGWRRETEERVARQGRRINALRGVITKMKKGRA